MRLSKVFQFASILTTLAVIYIHMQMQIIDLAYQGKREEKRIVDLKDGNKIISYNISRLKSANYLGVNLLFEDSELKFRGSKNILKVVTISPRAKEEVVLSSKKSAKTNPIMKFLSLRSQAEARDAEQKDSAKPWLRR